MVQQVRCSCYIKDYQVKKDENYSNWTGAENTLVFALA